MAVSERKIQAEQARRAYRLKVARRNETKDLDVPIIDGLIEGYLVPASRRGLPIDVKIPKWPNLPISGQTDTIFLEWARGGGSQYIVVAEQPFTGLVDEAAFPYPVTIGIDHIFDGAYKLRYRHRGWNADPNGSQDVLSDEFDLTIDFTPPYGITYPAPMIVPAGPITDDFWTTNPDGVVGEIPAYQDYAPGDQVAFFWVKDRVPDPLPPAIDFIPLPPDRKVLIPRTTIEDEEDGQFYAFYVLFDKAGNESRISQPQADPIPVALGPLPVEPLAEPVVPVADDGLVDRKDCFHEGGPAGVYVEIEAYEHGKIGTDLIELTWAGEVLSPLFPYTGSLMTVLVPWQTAKSHYDFDQGGEQEIGVSYRALRESLPFAATPITVDVDFSKVGPENPDEPSPTNPALKLVEVRGEVSDEKDKLTQDDNGRNARAIIELYDPVEPDEEILLYWKGVPLAQPYVITDEVAGQFIEIPVPWDDIDRAGNSSTLPVHYTVSAPGMINEERSDPTSVDVDVKVITLLAPTFTDKGSEAYLACRHLYGPEHGIRVHVPADGEYLTEGAVVKVEWLAYNGADEATATPIESTRKTATLPPVTPEQVINGINWLVEPYATHILPTYLPPDQKEGRANVRYWITIEGVDVPSEPTNILVAFYNGATSCPVT